MTLGSAVPAAWWAQPRVVNSAATRRRSRGHGLLNCGDCPRRNIVTRLAQLNLWNNRWTKRSPRSISAPASRIIVPTGKAIIKKNPGQVGGGVILGTHPYKPDIFSRESSGDREHPHGTPPNQCAIFLRLVRPVLPP